MFTREKGSMALWLAILLCYILQFIVCIHGQPGSRGFISIDCGIPENTSYQDATSSIVYVSDYGFISSGENCNVSSEYFVPSLTSRNFNLRFFPDGVRNCYTLRSLVAGNKYFARADFYYGNYDRLNKLPVFDLYLGANYWHEVNFSDAGAVNWMDIIVVAPADFLQVCLVNKGMGTPFISGLDLRPLRATLYPEANASQSLVLINSNRFHMGPTDNSIIRFPLDPHDRIWLTYNSIPSWTEISATSIVQNYLTDAFDVPSAVMQNAATPINASKIELLWDPSDPSVNLSSKYFFVFYFAELQRVPSNALRQFNVIIDNNTWNARPYTPPYLFADSLSGIVQGLARYSVSLVATENATLPPILNAIEIYLVQPMTQIATDAGDARAMMAIQANFGVKKNWMGDPCAPKAFAWDGLNCSYSPSDPPRITTLNLSSSGLAGAIVSSFGDLKALQYLYLSHNNLSGPVPDFLGQLPSLKLLDLSSNDLNGPIPYTLLQKSQNGTLVLRYSYNANLCAKGTTCKSGWRKSDRTLLIVIIVPVVVAISLFVITVLLLCRMINRKAKRKAADPKGEPMLLENQQFSYRELKHITNNFSQEIGKGGFGVVFLGYLEDGTPVAVKARSKSSSQGDKEFLAEAQHLTRIHHKNLVTLIGYCKDRSHLALVYEYMHEGNLQDHLRAASTTTLLTWQQRLQIALDAAQGLEYLHVACKPPLIHRDVKSRNILLSSNLEAKIADFGLTKAFSDSKTHVITAPAGTLGYLDPEYYRSYQVSEKSDMYSFGVVLLELVTGQPPAVPISESVSIHIGEWVHQNLDHGNIESIIDARMGGDFDINSVWKVANLALQCKDDVPRNRPTMTEVVAQLRESLELETRRDRKPKMDSGGESLMDLGDRHVLEVEEQAGEISEDVAPALR